MNYSQLIREAWAVTWRHRYLWILGLFAGGAVGAGGGSQTRWERNRGDVERWSPRAAEFAATAADWLEGNWVPLVIGAGIIMLAFLALSFIAQGGMAKATADIATGRGSSLGQAWRSGLHFCWRYVGLGLALFGIVLLVAAAVGVLLVIAIATGALAAGATPGDGAPAAIVAALLLIGIPLVLAGIAGAVVFSIVAAYAQRAVAIEDEGPVAALGDGWRLFRRNVGPSMLAWLVNLALSIGAGIAASVAIGVVAVILGVIGFALWAALGAHLATVAYAAVAGAAFVAVALTVAAIVNTFFWHYWTLAYLRLRGQTLAV